MEPVPPPLPRRRLHPAFWVTLLAPLVVGALILATTRGHDAANPIGYTLLAAVGCALASAIMLALALARTVPGRIFLGLGCFVLLQVFYTFALVGGCSAASGPMNMR